MVDVFVMRKTLLLVLAAAGLIMFAGVVVFHVGLDLSWLDSVYFVVTTMTTVGYGDYSLAAAPPSIKLFGIALMCAGPASVAAAFGIVTDYVLRTHLDLGFGLRVGRMKQHVVVCGLGKVGIRVAEQLATLGEQVVVVDEDQDGRFVPEANRLKIPIVYGDMRRTATLRSARVEFARSLVACSQQDLINLDAALHARELNPNIRIVLRIFDPTLARRIESGFGFDTAFSTSALAAPAFALSAVDNTVIGSVTVDDDILLNMRIEVQADSKLDGLQSTELANLGPFSLLSHRCKHTGEQQFNPSKPFAISAGDTLVVCVTPASRQRFQQLNTSV